MEDKKEENEVLHLLLSRIYSWVSLRLRWMAECDVKRCHEEIFSTSTTLAIEPGV